MFEKLVIGLLILGLAAVAGAKPKVLYRAVSPYNTLRVVQDGDLRILQVREGANFVEESRTSVKDPEKLIYEYSRLQMLGLAFPPKLERVLVVGLGGGSISKALAKTLPQAEIVSIELDPEIAKVARDFFFYKESDKVKTVVQDARAFLQSDRTRYDLIFLDAFSGLEIPATLRTRQFYELVKSHLAPGGAALANLHTQSGLYARDLATLAHVFPELTAFPGMALNMLVAQCEPAGEDRLAQRAQQFQLDLRRRIKLEIPPVEPISD